VNDDDDLSPFAKTGYRIRAGEREAREARKKSENEASVDRG